MADKPVTLRARVWVEISSVQNGKTSQMSPSVRGCGLKCALFVAFTQAGLVTLRARVWVEIIHAPSITERHEVTLRARVWVEMRHPGAKMAGWQRHPPCEGVG